MEATVVAGHVEQGGDGPTLVEQGIAMANPEVTHRDAAYHKRIHVYRPPSEPWDVQGEPSVPAWPAKRDVERCGDVEPGDRLADGLV